ncbi:class I SAM-dependent methyltransferase [Zoogloea sp.]|uniref:class I SAM-dependent methyltransferase n=1 Tax=Zoogloea sp. TaxID=49181 RepID=UPI002636598A|nr:class I SAM-dependent methyltransferase [Zoogloea sp.]MDD3352231.1 class I SAM-dependent methyltransferase [Zoogloea sp.]
MAPALKALVAQVTGWLVTFGLARSGLLPAGLLAIVLTQALTAAATATALGSAPWWRWIHLGFTPLVIGALQLEIAPGWYLAGFTGLVLVYWSSFRTQVPLFLSSRATAAAVAGLLPRGRPGHLLDLGSGTGALLRPLARLRPDLRLEGVESAPAPYALSRWLSRKSPTIALARGDFFQIPWSDYDLVYAFLSPAPMAQVWEKACAEMRPGALLVSNSFPVPGVEPERVIEVDDPRRTRLYCYIPAGTEWHKGRIGVP